MLKKLWLIEYLLVLSDSPSGRDCFGLLPNILKLNLFLLLFRGSIRIGGDMRSMEESLTFLVVVSSILPVDDDPVIELVRDSIKLSCFPNTTPVSTEPDRRPPTVLFAVRESSFCPNAIPASTEPDRRATTVLFARFRYTLLGFALLSLLGDCCCCVADM